MALVYGKRSARKCGNPFPPDNPTLRGRKRITFEKQAGVKSLPGRKRIGGEKRDNEGLQTVANVGHVLCVDLSSLRVLPSWRVVILTCGRVRVFPSLVQ